MSIPIALAVFDIDGVVRDVSGSYRRAIADTVEHFTQGHYRPSPIDIDQLKSEGVWNNDWKASQELIHRHGLASGQTYSSDYDAVVEYFQERYRGSGDDPSQWTGYITQEPILMTVDYLTKLASGGVPSAFFSGATRGSANYILQQRIGLVQPILIAMADAPSKPDPTGLYMTVEQLEKSTPAGLPVLYAGDTVADMATIEAAKAEFPERVWLGVGVLPPHVQTDTGYQNRYSHTLKEAGASIVLSHVEQLTAGKIQTLIKPKGC
ncbi:TIGR01548 family HAD-type hydrolase [Leptolyngbyaceae cyanobacterium CCMR0082]|uniref:TIGR01548 family HAD-type hydrolase n=2 Tax=Adonisia turfae TaxID=2950184 RepID=A0A6M0S4A7_9CYAN|nr:TIGR01548 family HAD-type hydrolase [Adonisia turfae]MDV3350437.1 TIGR01548 family HAD-type hydrolase [Leptothoe sp. LEGE 181152]NEZ59689.1 TIGR01548 family HAD-type hydrolase [Adonisia turfae CCMR0081]NEZ63288.1 TIGR01548 family HAD-type hydrolase [Adonisia turfae CCMR0082]